MTNQEVDVFVEELRNARTVNKTNTDVSKVVKFIYEPPQSEERPLPFHSIQEIRKPDREEYVSKVRFSTLFLKLDRVTF